MRVLLLSEDLQDLSPLKQRLEVGKRISHFRENSYLPASLPATDLRDVELLILDESSSNPLPMNDLEALCRANPRTLIMMIARNADAARLVAMVGAGVREILPWPASPAEIDHALEQCVEKIDGLGMQRNGRIIAVIPGKGGSGATFVATNVAFACALQLEQRTLIIDFDLQYGDASFAFGKEPHSSNVLAMLQDDAIDAALLEAACLPLRRNLSLLASPFTTQGSSSADTAAVGRLLAFAARAFDVVIIDLPPQIDALTAAVMTQSNKVLQIVTPTVEALRNQQRQRSFLHDLGVPVAKISVVLNQTPSKGAAASSSQAFADDIEGRLGKDIIARLPADDDTALLALAAGQSVIEIHATEPISRAITALAKILCEHEIEDKGLLQRLARWRHADKSSRHDR